MSPPINRQTEGVLKIETVSGEAGHLMGLPERRWMRLLRARLYDVIEATNDRTAVAPFPDQASTSAPPTSPTRRSRTTSRRSRAWRWPSARRSCRSTSSARRTSWPSRSQSPARSPRQKPSSSAWGSTPGPSRVGQGKVSLLLHAHLNVGRDACSSDATPCSPFLPKHPSSSRPLPCTGGIIGGLLPRYR